MEGPRAEDPRLQAAPREGGDVAFRFLPHAFRAPSPGTSSLLLFNKPYHLLWFPESSWLFIDFATWLPYPVSPKDDDCTKRYEL